MVSQDICRLSDTVMICDFCEGPEHINGPCPLSQHPNPQLIMYGYAHEELIFSSFRILILTVQR